MNYTILSYSRMQPYPSFKLPLVLLLHLQLVVELLLQPLLGELNLTDCSLILQSPLSSYTSTQHTHIFSFIWFNQKNNKVP